MDLIYDPVAHYEAIDGPNQSLSGKESENDEHETLFTADGHNGYFDDDADGIEKRDGRVMVNDDYSNAMMSLPSGWNHVFESPSDVYNPSERRFKYHLDSTEGEGQRVYVIEQNFDFSHQVRIV